MGRSTGRPKALTDALKAEVCERIANGETVRGIAADEHMPVASTLYLTLATDTAFSDQYARAREAQLVRWEDELVEIADDTSQDFRKRGDGEGEAIDHEHIARSKVRIDTRKWLMAKRLPKKYGERVVQEVTGKDGGAVEVADVSDRERAKAMALLIAKAREAAPE